jgi:hypothetical protein
MDDVVSGGRELISIQLVYSFLILEVFSLIDFECRICLSAMHITFNVSIHLTNHKFRNRNHWLSSNNLWYATQIAFNSLVKSFISYIREPVQAKERS